MGSEEIIRCMLLPLADDWLLVPNVTVAEIIAFVEPKYSSEDDFLLGYMDWRGVKVPIIYFENICDLTKKENSIRDRIAILYHPDGDTKKPYIGVKLTDIPRSFRAEVNNLQEETISISRDDLIVKQITDDNRRLFIPDLDKIFKHLP